MIPHKARQEERSIEDGAEIVPRTAHGDIAVRIVLTNRVDQVTWEPILTVVGAWAGFRPPGIIETR